MIPLSPFNQRLTKSVQGDGAVAVITRCFCNPSRQSTAQHRRYKHVKGFLDFTPHHHQPQQIFIYRLLYAGHFARCGKGKLEEKFPKDFEKGSMCPSEVSYLSLKWVTESFVKGDKCNSFYKEKWSRPTCTVRLLCVQFWLNAGKWCHHNYSTEWWPSRCREAKPSAVCIDIPLVALSPDSAPNPRHCQTQWVKCCHSPALHSATKCEDWIYECFEVKKMCTFEKGSGSPKFVTQRVKTTAMVSERKKNSMNTKFPYAFVNEFRKTKETSLSYKCSLSHSAMQSL